MYTGFGLKILSEIYFPELHAANFDDEPNLKICFGQIPQSIEGENVTEKLGTFLSAEAYLVDIKTVAGYYATNGNLITVQPHAGSDDTSVRLFLLSNAISAILHQRDVIPFHASGIITENGVVLFCGHAGAGKSVLAAAMEQLGYPVFTDDICVMELAPETGAGVQVWPSYPMMQLWADGFYLLNMPPANEATRLRPNLLKFAKPFNHDFTNQPLPINKIFILSKDSSIEEFEVKEITSLKSFSVLQHQVYKPAQMHAVNKRVPVFKLLSWLGAGTPIKTIIIPQTGNVTAQLTELVIKHIS